MRTNDTQNMIKEYINYSLLHHNTFGFDVKCSRFIEFSSIEGLKEALDRVDAPNYQGRPPFVIGGGSNLVFTADYAGTLLHSTIHGREVVAEDDREVSLRIGSGENWDETAAWCTAHGWYGTENLSLIPGDTGAAAIQNIGAYGVEIKDLVDKVETVEIATGKERIFTNAECHYAYRRSIFKEELKGKYVVTYVTLKLNKVFHPRLDYGNIRTELAKEGLLPAADSMDFSKVTAQGLRDAIIRIRRAKLPDPAEIGSAGSFFMNPIIPRMLYDRLTTRYPDMPHYELEDGRIKVPAGWLIDRCGWKGRQLGKAGVYPRQALVLVNEGGADGIDIVTLSNTIRKDIRRHFNIEITPEANII